MPSKPSFTPEVTSAKLFNKLNVLWLVTTVLVFSALVKLGWWPSARALEKEQRLAHIAQLS